MLLLERGHILAHRGLWRTPDEKNSRKAFDAAFSHGFGLETDLRDANGVIVVSHDMPGTDPMTFGELLEMYIETGCQSTLALNIKADGLSSAISAELVRMGIENYFAFDMSVPETLRYFSAGLTTFTRRSQFESGCALDGRAQGRWLDAFEGAIVSNSLIEEAIRQAIPFVLVSPELHGLPHMDAWVEWRETLARLSADPALVQICTDLPVDARQFFGN